MEHDMRRLSTTEGTDGGLGVTNLLLIQLRCYSLAIYTCLKYCTLRTREIYNRSAASSPGLRASITCKVSLPRS